MRRCPGSGRPRHGPVRRGGVKAFCPAAAEYGCGGALQPISPAAYPAVKRTVELSAGAGLRLTAPRRDWAWRAAIGAGDRREIAYPGESGSPGRAAEESVD
jgi:hypothetical protein